uniref:Uncharacterized protein n=1 Tax=Mesocestoides corti TaxID=53468 RepID=A0A5K3EMH8_MESCO
MSSRLSRPRSQSCRVDMVVASMWLRVPHLGLFTAPTTSAQSRKRSNLLRATTN